MKKIRKVIVLVLTLCLVLSLAPASVFAEKSEPYKYTITPDSKDWANYKTYELTELTNIPDSIVADMDTATLVSTVIDYPFLGDIYAFESTDIGIQVVSERFSGLKELLGRSDAGNNLYIEFSSMKSEVEALNNVDYVDYKTVMKHKIMGTLLSQPDIFKQLDQDQVNSIVGSSSTISEELNVTPIYADDESPFAAAARYLTAYVYTPEGSAVQVLIRGEELTSADKTAMNNYMATLHPNATRLRTATTNYNCHSYAWYSTSSSNVYWMNSPSAYMTDGSYTEVGFTPTAAGQKMYYPVTGGHSAIVYTPSSNIWNVQLTSKWGQYGLYRHYYGDDPYGNGALNITCWE